MSVVLVCVGCSGGRDMAWVLWKRRKGLGGVEVVVVVDLMETVGGRRKVVDRFDGRVVEETLRGCRVPVLPESVDARCSHLRRGWYWGGQAFLAKLNQLAKKPIKERVGMTRDSRRSPQVKSHGEEQAERWLEEGLKTAGLDVKDLRALKGSDPRKLVLVELLWKRTTVSQEWLAEKRSMRSPANVS